ncbi:MAG: DNA-3-methyladenine glycosylase 2 family protein [Aestuariivirga sp.]
MTRYQKQADLEAAIVALGKIEPRFAAVHAAHGTPSLRKAKPSLETLMKVVTEQFLSIKAADAIWARAKTRIGEVAVENVLAVSVEEFLALGVSRGKAKCFHACASANIDFRALSKMPIEELRKRLLAIWGIGPWTADIYLLSVVGHGDAWPSGDVALQASAHHLFNMRKRPDAKKLEKLALKWRPHRAAAARLLWAHYRTLKEMPQAT